MNVCLDYKIITMTEAVETCLVDVFKYSVVPQALEVLCFKA